MKTALLHSIDITIFLLILFMLRGTENLLSSLLFLCAGYLIYILATKFLKKTKVIMLCCFLIQGTVAYFLCSFSLINALLGSLLFFVVYVRKDISIGQKYLFSLCSVGCGVFLTMSSPSKLEISLLVIQGVLSLFVTSHNKQQRLFRFTTLGLIGIVSLSVQYILPYIQAMFSFLTKHLALGTGYILMPLFRFYLGNQVEETWNKYQNHVRQEPIEGPQVQQSGQSSFLYYVLLVLIFSVSLYVLYRIVKRKFSYVYSDYSRDWHVLSDSSKREKQRRSKKIPIPTNPVRKEILRLEKVLKQPLRRQRGETMEQWLGRLKEDEGVQIDVEFLTQAYNEARYYNSETNKAILEATKQEVAYIIKSQKKRK
ncbi:DUF4018 domain-containing protein [Microbacteriaceae bacterium 4G12]